VLNHANSLRSGDAFDVSYGRRGNSEEVVVPRMANRILSACREEDL